MYIFLAYTLLVGSARTIYIRCIYGVFGREINKYTIVYGVYIRFWPTLITCKGKHMCATTLFGILRAKHATTIVQ